MVDIRSQLVQLSLVQPFVIIEKYTPNASLYRIYIIIVIITSFKPSFRIIEKYSPRIAAVFSTIGIVKTYKLVCLELINKIFTN